MIELEFGTFQIQIDCHWSMKVGKLMKYMKTNKQNVEKASFYVKKKVLWWIFVPHLVEYLFHSQKSTQYVPSLGQYTYVKDVFKMVQKLFTRSKPNEEISGWKHDWCIEELK